MTWKHSGAAITLLLSFFVVIVEIMQPFPRVLVIFIAVLVGMLSAMYLWDVPMEEDDA